LSGVRDEIVEHVINKRNNACLNVFFGLLNLRQGGAVEFKSNASVPPAVDDYDKLPSDYDRFSSMMSKTHNSASFAVRKQSE